ncbi:hypothetical protein CEXT_408221 [Caerostris extrusa]|uniref:Uncharacterized protein n=1 Tax=Caerostris extrusa TaxID=172846 RepID=A0AAV4NIB2_CAEEX|nr:hypothetical protein CEXT_408221 [Caerostris extrusa]
MEAGPLLSILQCDLKPWKLTDDSDDDIFIIEESSHRLQWRIPAGLLELGLSSVSPHHLLMTDDIVQERSDLRAHSHQRGEESSH